MPNYHFGLLIYETSFPLIWISFLWGASFYCRPVPAQYLCHANVLPPALPLHPPLLQNAKSVNSSDVCLYAVVVHVLFCIVLYWPCACAVCMVPGLYECICYGCVLYDPVLTLVPCVVYLWNVCYTVCALINCVSCVCGVRCTL